MTGGGSDPQGGRRIPQHWTNGGSVESGDGDYKFLPYHLHCLKRHPPQIMGRSRYRYRLPRGQTDPEGNSYEVGGPVRDISGSEQGAWCLGQGKITGDTREIDSRATGLSHPPYLLGHTYDSGLRGWILLRGFPRF